MPADDKEKVAASPPKASKLLPILVILNLAATAYAGVRVTLPQETVVVNEVLNDAAVDAAAPPPIVAMEKPFVVNLNEGEGGRYLKVQISVELADSAAEAELKKADQVVRDDLLRYLSGLTVKETMGEESKSQIQSTIVARLNEILDGDERVKRVLFSEFVIQ